MSTSGVLTQNSLTVMKIKEKLEIVTNQRSLADHDNQTPWGLLS